MTFVPANLIKQNGKDYTFKGYVNGNSSKDAKQEFREKNGLPKGTGLIVIAIEALPDGKKYPEVYAKRTKYAVWQEMKNIKRKSSKKPSRFEGIL
jgi:hypothetical protein